MPQHDEAVQALRPRVDEQEPSLRRPADAGNPSDRQPVARGRELDREDLHRGRLVGADPPVRCGVEDRHGAVEVPHRHERSVRARRDVDQAVAVAVEESDRGRAAHQHAEQVGAGRERVVERVARDGELQRAVEPLDGHRLGAEALGGLLARGVARGRALRAGDKPGDHRERQQHAGPREQRAQPAVGAALAVGLALRGGGARVDEAPLGRVERIRMATRPVGRRTEAGAAVEVSRLAAAGLPEPRGVAEVAVEQDAGAVLLEPAPQRRPFADEHFVGDLGGAVAEGQQPRLGEPLEQRLDLLARSVLGHELAHRDAPARVLDPLAELGQAHEDAAQERVALDRDRFDNRVGRLGNGQRDAAALAVALDGQRAPVAVLPGDPQRVREQGQRPGLAGHVAHDQLDQAGVEPQAGEARGLDHGALELVVVHRPEQHLVLRHRAGQVRVIGHLAVEVGAHGDQHRRAQREQAVDERPAAIAVVTKRVELLELVDDDELVRVVGHVELGRGARDHDRRAVELLDLAREHRRHDTGAHDGGLAAARRADDGEQPPRLEPIDGIGDDVLAAEEERAVGGLEGQEGRGTGTRRPAAGWTARGRSARGSALGLRRRAAGRARGRRGRNPPAGRRARWWPMR